MSLNSTKQLIAALKKHKTLKAVHRATGTSWHKTHDLYKLALAEGLIDQPLPQGAPSREAQSRQIKPRKAGGRVKALRLAQIDVTPDKAGIRRYIFTSAQNNTRLHEKFWTNLVAFSEHLGARLCVSRFTYNKRWHLDMDKAQINQVGKKDAGEFWWDPKLQPYLLDERAVVATGLVWCGEMNIIPTAVRPLSGLETYTGRNSGIFPHAKIAMESIAAGKYEPTKFNYTTGTVTQRNYIQRKEGLKAEFHHCYGALLVEVDEDGNWYCRQLNADSTGTFYDLDLRAKDGEVTDGHRVEGLTIGDIHVDQIDKTAKDLIWEEGGVVDVLNPKRQFLHDVLDFYRQNHHEVQNPHTQFRKHIEGKTSVAKELVDVRDFLADVARPDVETLVVDSNHHHALGRWLREQNGLKDPSNAEIWLKVHGAVYDSIRANATEPNYLRIAMQAIGEPKFEKKYGIKFLDQDESYIICNDANGGIECGLHGHDGPNGSRGSPRSLAKMGRKANTGHTHVAGIYDGVYTAGCTCILDPEYVRGPSAWSQSHIVTYANGKRAIITFWAGKWRA